MKVMIFITYVLVCIITPWNGFRYYKNITIGTDNT